VELGVAYPCTCSRRDSETAASAPHAEDAASAAYPGTCRDRYVSADEATATGRPVAWRLRVSEEPIVVEDQFARSADLLAAAEGGRHAFDLSRLEGDFVIFKSSGQAAYQLAVVVDDASVGVDAVVRGNDLLDSAARQIYIRRLLGLTPEPKYWHLPLVVGPDGRRLAKRHGDTRLSHYREAGATPQRVLGLLGYWTGLLPERREVGMLELINDFDIDRVPRRPIVFSREDDSFLTGG
jgi:glutamyl-tRNA synthetase